jgi:putative SOS response-associated peptidase YedK
MCGRYARRSDKQKIAERFQVFRRADLVVYEEFEDRNGLSEDAEGSSFETAPNYNVAPQTMQPVVRLDTEAGGREVAMLRWGLIPYWSKDSKIAHSTINARSETITTSPIFREAVKRRRCLVPADAFYEWQKLDTKTRQPYAIAVNDQETFAFAGLWETWRDKAADRILETYTILTTDPNELMEPFHDRMPVILDPEDYERWLEPGNAAHLPVDLLRPYPAKKMRSWKVSNRVGNVRNNDAELLAPLVEAPQAPAQGSLFG